MRSLRLVCQKLGRWEGGDIRVYAEEYLKEKWLKHQKVKKQKE